MKRNFLPILSTEMITIYEVAIKSAAPAWSDPANYLFCVPQLLFFYGCKDLKVIILYAGASNCIYTLPVTLFHLDYRCKDSQSMLASKTNLWFVIAIELSNILLYRLERKHWRNNGSRSNNIPLPCMQRALWYQSFFYTKKSNNINMKGFFIKALILVWSKLFSTDPDMKAFSLQAHIP